MRHTVAPVTGTVKPRVVLAQEIAALVPMAPLLEALGFQVNTRTHRSRCLLHGGTNPTSFSWREDGRWFCHSCGRGGGRIALIRAVRRCDSKEALRFLAGLGGIQYRPGRVSPKGVAARKRRRARAEAAAWRVADRVGELRARYHHVLLRADRLCWLLGEQLCRAQEEEREILWTALARLAPAQTFLLAAWHFFSGAPSGTLARAALSTPAERRKLMLEGNACG